MPDQEALRGDFAQAAAADVVYPQDRFSGRGIVICAGGARMFTCAWIAISMLRKHLGCTLPIEVWYLGPQEMGPPMRGLLQELDAEPVDALEVAKRHPVQRLGGWELKAYALLHSRFAEALLLDADNLPLRDPAFLFHTAPYRETGVLFWPDLVRILPDNAIWTIANTPYRDMPSIESGQMLVDKTRGWRALHLAHWMNQRSDAFYQLLHGDKDTFLIAWLALDQPFHQILHRAKALHGTLCQHDLDGVVLFQHRNWAKWILHGDNPHVEGFRRESECFELLAELKSAWDGRVFNPPPRSEGARFIETMLARTGDFIVTRISSDERPIALLPDHRIRSSVDLERYWYVADGDPAPELRIEGEGVPVYTLRQDGDRIWRGRMHQAPAAPVELAPVAVRAPRVAPDAPPTGLHTVVDRILALAGKLPADGETARDLAGAVRLLSAIDPSVAAHLAAMPEHARLIRAALATQGEIARGTGWMSGIGTLDTHYERR